MKKEFISIFAIILGIIIIALPMFGVIAASAVIGLSLLLISVFLLVLGSATMDSNKWGSIGYLLLGILILIVSILIIFNTNLFTILTEYMLYLAGIFLIIIGIVTLINNRMSKYGFIRGIVTILLGLIYLILGSLIKDPVILGYLIGFWLVLTGIVRLIDR